MRLQRFELLLLLFLLLHRLKCGGALNILEIDVCSSLIAAGHDNGWPLPDDLFLELDADHVRAAAQTDLAEPPLVVRLQFKSLTGLGVLEDQRDAREGFALLVADLPGNGAVGLGCGARAQPRRERPHDQDKRNPCPEASGAIHDDGYLL